MNSIFILGGTVLVLLIAYFAYGSWLARRWGIKPRHLTPAHGKDNLDYAKTEGPVLLGHHFASITGIGAIQGPIMAAIFGWVPVLLWVLLGGIFLGAVQDFGALFVSVRNKGQSMAAVIRKQMGTKSGICTLILSWLICVLVIAAFADLVGDAFAGITVDDTGMEVKNVANASVAMASMMMIPVSIFTGYLNRLRCPVALTTFFGLILLAGCVGIGVVVPLYLPKELWMLVIGAYIFLSSVLPIWFLQQPRNYLSSFLIYALMLAAGIGVCVARPEMQLAAFGGWKIDGKWLFPYLFVTVVGGAFSGYNSLVSSGVTSRQLNNERNARAVSYGAMLLQSLLAVIALVAFAAVSADGTWSGYDSALDAFAAAICGFFSSFGLKGQWETIAKTVILMVFAALIMTTLDTSLRVGRTLLQEAFGAVDKEKKNFFTSAFFTSAVTLAAATGVFYLGYERIWPLMGSLVQLLAVPVCLGIACWLKQMGKFWKVLILPAIAGLFISVSSLGMLFMENLKILQNQDKESDLWNAGIQEVLITAAAIMLVLILIDGVRALKKKRTIIFATGNEGKMKEVREILADLDMEILSLKDAGIEAEIEEDGLTFEDNAIIKAKAICKMTNQLVLADDSGLEVDYLDKEPGVYSARYMGEDTSYDIKNAAIVKRLEGVPEEKRTARFVCVIAAADPDGQVLTTRGTMEGTIGYEEKGSNGFGYDPIFYLKEYGCTSAELNMEQKNEVSHRGKALRAMKEKLL